MAFTHNRSCWITRIVTVAFLLAPVWGDSIQNLLAINSTAQTGRLSYEDALDNITSMNSSTTESSFKNFNNNKDGGLVEQSTDSQPVNTTIQPKNDRLLSMDPVLEVSVGEKPWYNYTILFDETLVNSWIACLSNDQASSCLTDTEYIYGSPYVHQANLTSQTTSDNTTGEIFFCQLEDLRYIQGNGAVRCSRGLTTCNETLQVTACIVTTFQDTARFYWDLNQDFAVDYKSQFVNVSCGNECFQDPPTSLPAAATTEAMVVEASDKDNTYIWIIVGVILGVLLIVLVIIIVVVLYRRHRKDKKGSKTLEDGGGKPSEVRSSVLFRREEDPSDELRVHENHDISGIAYANIELSENSKRQSGISSSSTSAKGNEYSNIESSRTSNTVLRSNDEVNVISDSEASGSLKGKAVKHEDVKESRSNIEVKKETPASDVPSSDNVDTSKTCNYATLGDTRQPERNPYDTLQKISEDPQTGNAPKKTQSKISDGLREPEQSYSQGDKLHAKSEQQNKTSQHVRNYSDQDETDGSYIDLKRTIKEQL